MDRKPVSSSSIRSIGFDEDNEVLEIEFKNGGVYQYSNVAKITFERLMRAPSKGHFVATDIKERYKTTKVR